MTAHRMQCRLFLSRYHLERCQGAIESLATKRTYAEKALLPLTQAENSTKHKTASITGNLLLEYISSKHSEYLSGDGEFCGDRCENQFKSLR
jgi:hypothetical protein